jgi:hypothetical protein
MNRLLNFHLLSRKVVHAFWERGSRNSSTIVNQHFKHCLCHCSMTVTSVYSLALSGLSTEETEIHRSQIGEMTFTI